MEATESASKPDEAKIAILLYLIGDEGQDIFETFAIPEENAKNFEAVMQAFDTYCVPKKKRKRLQTYFLPTCTKRRRTHRRIHN